MLKVAQYKEQNEHFKSMETYFMSTAHTVFPLNKGPWGNHYFHQTAACVYFKFRWMKLSNSICTGFQVSLLLPIFLHAKRKSTTWHVHVRKYMPRQVLMFLCLVWLFKLHFSEVRWLLSSALFPTQTLVLRGWTRCLLFRYFWQSRDWTTSGKDR